LAVTGSVFLLSDFDAEEVDATSMIRTSTPPEAVL
jgi:hypothetical protein